MKWLCWCVRCGILGLLLVSASGVQSDAELVVEISGFRNSKGNAGAALFQSAAGFPREQNQALRKQPGPIQDGQATIVFSHLPPGAYAVAVIHDENGNAKLDTNFLGIPREAFGFSNNPPVHLRAPSFDSARITVSAPRTVVQIHLQYP